MGERASLTDMIEAGLRGIGLRQAVIANNIANLNTPGYRRGAVEFEKLLAETLERARPEDLAALEPMVYRPMTTPINADGNDVSLDMEVGDLIKNSGTYKLYLRLMAKLYEQMELAVRG